ncbi:MAG: ABC transporter permease [Acidimicrobiales bacterium]
MLRIARRGLRAHRVRLALTAAVVALAVAYVASSLVLTDTVATGLDAAAAGDLAGTEVVVRSTETVPTFFGTDRAPVGTEVLDAVRAVPGVVAAGVTEAPLSVLDADGRPLAGPRDGGRTTVGRGWVDDEALGGWRLAEGRPPTTDGEVVLDRRFAADHGLGVGAPLLLALAEGPRPVTVVGTAVPVDGIHPAGTDTVLLAPPAAATELLGRAAASWVGVRGTAGSDPATVLARVRSALRPVAGTEAVPAATVVDERRANGARALDAVRRLLGGVALVALVVAAFVIANTFRLVVAEQGRELALLRAVGARRRQVVGVVLAEGLLLGTAASVVGLVLGVGLAAAAGPTVARLGPAVDVGATVVGAGALLPGLLLGIGVTVLSSVVPAARAARLPPLAALRRPDTEDTAVPPWRLVAGIASTAAGAGLLVAGGRGAGDDPLAIAGIGMAVAFAGLVVLAGAVVAPLGRGLGRPLTAWRGVTGRLAANEAGRHPGRSAATASALVVGLALVALVAVLGESLRASTGDAVGRALRAELVVDRAGAGPASGAAGGLSPALARELDAVPGVAAATGLRLGIARLDGQPELVVGIDPERFARVVHLDVEGSLGALGRDGVAVSRRDAEQNGWQLGTTVQARFLEGGTVPLQVRAVFDSALLQGTSGVLVSQDLFDERFPAPARTDLQVYVALDDGVLVDDVRPALQAVVGRHPPARLQDQAGFTRTQTEPVDRVVLYLWALLALAVVLGVAGIANTLVLSVHERRRELGLLRAAGMTGRQLRSAVRIEAVLLAALGTALGLALGIASAAAVVGALHDQGLTVLALPWAQLGAMVVVTALAAVAAAAWPARRAARVDVVAALEPD